jgi:hypothetical protein
MEFQNYPFLKMVGKPVFTCLLAYEIWENIGYVLEKKFFFADFPFLGLSMDKYHDLSIKCFPSVSTPQKSSSA